MIQEINKSQFFKSLVTGFVYKKGVFRPRFPKFILINSDWVFSLLFFLSMSQLALAVETNIIPTTGSGGLNTEVTPNGNNYEIRGGEQQGTNLFHSFQDFNVGAGDTGKFVNNNGSAVSNILSRVTGGNISEINGSIDSQAFPNANFYFINPAGVIFGADASLNIGGSFYVSTADYLSLKDGVKFYADPSKQNSLLTTAAPAAFGFLQDSPAAITLNGSTLRVRQGKTVSVTAGNINFDHGRLSAQGGTVALTSVAMAGEIELATDTSVSPIIGADIILTEKSQINTSDDGGGHIVIRGGNLVIDRSSVISKNLAEPNSKDIDISLSGKLEVKNDALIETSTSSTGKGGDINIRAAELFLQGGQLNANTSGEGQGGEITILADHLSVGADAAAGSPGQINASTNGSGSAGTISLNVDQLLVMDNSAINAFSRGTATGDAGNINVQAKQIVLSGGGSFNATSLGSGDGGDISVTADRLVTLQGVADNATGSSTASGLYSDNKSGGNGGRISITTPELLIEGGEIAARSSGDGSGGEITVFADHLTMRADSAGHRARITVESKGMSDIGNINIHAEDIKLSDSTISAANRSVLDSTGQSAEVNTQSFQRNGGNIMLMAKEFIHLFDSEISTKVGVGSGEGGNIDMDSKVIVMNSSQIIADAARGNGGNIQIEADAFFKSPDSTVSASSELGIDGEIVIKSPVTDIISSIQLLPADFLDVTSILSSPCAQHLASDVSHLVIRRYEVLPDSPYALRTFRPSIQQPDSQHSASHLLDKGC